MATQGTKKPAPLTRTEKRWSALLVALGLAFVIGIVGWFAGSTNGSLKTKSTTISEPVGENATGAKETKTDEYSENIVLGCLGIGAVLIVAGAFYGRIREIKLPGGVSVGIGELPEDKQEVIEQAVEQKAGQAMADPAQRQVVVAAAKQMALDRFRADYWGPVPRPPDPYLQSVAAEETEKAIAAVRSVQGQAP